MDAVGLPVNAWDWIVLLPVATAASVFLMLLFT